MLVNEKLEKEIKEKGIKAMEEELIRVNNKVTFAEQEVSSLIEHVNLWKYKLMVAREMLVGTVEEYKEERAKLEVARRLVKC